MAKALSKGDGAVSVAALFNSCVDNFKCIRLSRQFGEDFERCQLKLEVAKSRFGRWGEAVGVNSKPRFTSAAQQSDDVVGDVLEILGGIEPYFKSAQKKSLRYAKNNTDAGLVKKSTWALYDKKSLDSIISQILSWIDELESLFPDEMTAIQKFIEIDTEPINGKPSLETPHKAARGTDSWHRLGLGKSAEEQGSSP
ncbi:prion-inhibition and propagation domain-containing protein [Trichoderma austrokoningii]